MESYYGGAVSKPADMPKYLDKDTRATLVGLNDLYLGFHLMLRV